jgi:hypothetical protein
MMQSQNYCCGSNRNIWLATVPNNFMIRRQLKLEFRSIGACPKIKVHPKKDSWNMRIRIDQLKPVGTRLETMNIKQTLEKDC